MSVELQQGDAVTVSELSGWLDDLANRDLMPAAPLRQVAAMNVQFVSPAGEVFAEAVPEEFTVVDVERETRIASAMRVADRLLASDRDDVRWSAAPLFYVLADNGRRDWLEKRCRGDVRAEPMLEGFVGALQAYYEILLRQGKRTPTSAPAPSKVAAAIKTVIVHGTWARDKPWWQQPAAGVVNFWSYVNNLTHDCVGTGHEFSWSGGLTDGDRHQGGREFVNWWNTEGRPSLQVIAHSHGGNVVWHALELEPALKLRSMVVLGAPICIGYPLRVTQLGKVANVYSEHDSTQPTGAKLAGARGEGRTLPDSVDLTNCHVPHWDPSVRTQKVGHSDLHEPAVWHANRLDKLLV